MTAWPSAFTQRVRIKGYYWTLATHFKWNDLFHLPAVYTLEVKDHV